MRPHRIATTILSSLPLLLGACALSNGHELELTDHGPELSATTWESKPLYIPRFSHSTVSEVTQVHVSGSNGYGASGIAVTRMRLMGAPLPLVHALEEQGVFPAVIPGEPPEGVPHYVLEGTVQTEWEAPWWSVAQLALLHLPSWFLPTMGREAVSTGNISVYDEQRHLIHRWEFRYENAYLAWIWWGFAHGGASDTGSDIEEQEEAVRVLAQEIGGRIRTVQLAQASRSRSEEPRVARNER